MGSLEEDSSLFGVFRRGTPISGNAHIYIYIYIYIHFYTYIYRAYRASLDELSRLQGPLRISWQVKMRHINQARARYVQSKT